MAEKKLIVRGANENNLKNIDVTIPRGKLVVLTADIDLENMTLDETSYLIDLNFKYFYMILNNTK